MSSGTHRSGTLPRMHPYASVGAEDAPVTEAIRSGHQGVLDTLREFAGEFEAAAGDAPDPELLRALVAFLRQGLLPFARWEEEHFRGPAEVASDAAFEHAFLNAEIDALASLAAEVGGAASSVNAGRRVHRSIHRIEAILELHVQKDVDREGAADPLLPRLATGGAAPTRVEVMEAAAIDELLRAGRWGILCTVAADGAPYGVPVAYGYDGDALFLATGPGRKRENLERTPAVCLTVAEVENGQRWRSVVVTGTATPVSELRGRLQALDALRRQRSQEGPPSPADLARLARATLFRIEPREITGRARG